MTTATLTPTPYQLSMPAIKSTQPVYICETNEQVAAKMGDVLRDDDVYIAFKSFAMILDYMYNHELMSDKRLAIYCERQHRAINSDSKQMRDGILDAKLNLVRISTKNYVLPCALFDSGD